MADSSGNPVAPISVERANGNHANGNGNGPLSPVSWKGEPRGPIKRSSSGIELEDYFSGPRDMDRHSKLPFFMRMHGSVLPKMIIPLVVIGAWATCITCINEFTRAKLVVDSLLLTVLGFVVGLALSFRSSTAYERYAEGRKLWAQLILASQNLSRMIWIHTKEREGDQGKEDLLRKITALNLIKGYARAVKHKLRFEPGIDHSDIHDLVCYLETFSKAARDDIYKPGAKSPWKKTGESLGLTFAESNPRKILKRTTTKPLGNLPVEILNHLSTYVESIFVSGQLTIPIFQTHTVNSIATMNEVLVGVERVLNTPLPIAYGIAISQITWVYIVLLPFQLWAKLNWITIPGTMVAAYIILGLAAIGREIENPFGHDVNDLPLDNFCEQIDEEISIIASTLPPDVNEFMAREDNFVLAPLSHKNYDGWLQRPKQDIRNALMTKANVNLVQRQSISQPRPSHAKDNAHHHTIEAV